MSKYAKSDMPHLNGNKLMVMDVETTGLRAGYHEICQICFLPVTAGFEIDESIDPFVALIRPEFPNRWEPAAARVNGLKDKSAKHGLDKDLVYDMFVEWFFKMGLSKSGEFPYTKQFMPLAKNWAFDKAFIDEWMGADDEGKRNMDYFVHRYARDLQPATLYLNDLAYMNNNQAYPFTRMSLTTVCSRLNVDLPNAHDALGDCVATLECYRRILSLRLPLGEVDVNIKHPSWKDLLAALPQEYHATEDGLEALEGLIRAEEEVVIVAEQPDF